MSEKKYVFKVCLLGEPNVGKTSLVYRFVKNIFKENLASTIGVNISKKSIQLDGKDIKIHLWDLGGDQKFQPMRDTFLAGARGALLVFDLTNKKTLENIDKWIKHFENIMGKQPMVLVGNKADLLDHIEINESELKQVAEERNIPFIITSAKTGENVENAFKNLTIEMMKKSKI
ncbi:MAG: Rab family GTPase [Promethearchaeota archaeon]